MRKQDTLFSFFSGQFPSLIHLFEGLSVARITALDKHSALSLTATDCYTGCNSKCNIDGETQPFKIPWEMKEKKTENPGVLFYLQIILYVHYLRICALDDSELLITVISPSIAHIANYMDFNFTLYWLPIMRMNNIWFPHERFPQSKWQDQSFLWMRMQMYTWSVCLCLYITVHACNVT